MNLQPHVIILHWIRSEFKRLSQHPEYMNFILGGYAYNPSMSNIYGAKFVDNAVTWFKNNEKTFNYVLGYRLDMSKVPSVSVMASGGTESRQIIGDYDGAEFVDIYPQKFTTFHASGVSDEGWLIVPKEYNLEQTIWRGLTIARDGVEPKTITGLLKLEDENLLIEANSPFSLEEGLSDWQIYSCSNAKRYAIGSSFDRISVQIYMDVPGDPELCEMMSSVMRAALKNARMYLIANGLNEVSIAYSPIGKNESYGGVNVWTAQFTLNAVMTDRWIMNESVLPEYMRLVMECERGV
jgi:hypothetical protein